MSDVKVMVETTKVDEGEGRGRWSGLTGGIILILIGAIFLMARLDYLDGRDFWRYAPLVLVGLGVARMLDATGWPRLRSGMNLMVIGGWLLVNTLELGDFEWDNSWPLLLIGFGAIAVIEAVYRSRFERRRGAAGAGSGDDAR